MIAQPLELTHVPINQLGAICVFAVLCYPGVDGRAHGKRDLLIGAYKDRVRIAARNRKGYRRISAARIQTDGWLAERPSIKTGKIEATLQRADSTVRKRLLAGRIARHLERVWGSKRTPKAVHILVGGRESLSRVVGDFSAICGVDNGTLWRLWGSSLPVLHLACALFESLLGAEIPENINGTILDWQRDHQQWLPRTLELAEDHYARVLPAFTEFDPSKRVSLAPE
jgi:hypothetical protein